MIMNNIHIKSILPLKPDFTLHKEIIPKQSQL